MNTTFIKSIFSDSADASFSRISGAVVILALILWDTFIIITTEASERAIQDIPLYWLTLIIGLYGINKTGDIIKTVKGVATNVPNEPAA